MTTLLQLSATLDVIPSPIAIIDSDDQFAYANAAFLTRYGWSNAEIIRLNAAVILPRGYSESELKSLRKKITDSSEGYSVSLRNRNKNGDVFSVELSCFSIKLIEGLPARFSLWVFADTGGSDKAIRAIITSLLSSHPEVKPHLDTPQKTDKVALIKNLYKCGYNTKEIAGFLSVGINTPHVILHRARKKHK